jgi:hypothetical protein
MKKIEIESLENLNGGKITTGCAVGIAGALVFGMGGVIAAAGGPITGIAFAMAANYFAWGSAAYGCM